MKPRSTWSWLLIAACLFASGVANLPGPANAASRRSLRSRLRAINEKKARTQRQLKNLKAEQASQRNQLVKAQVELDAAEENLDIAEERLDRTRRVLTEVKRDHRKARNRHQTQKKRMEARILAQYEAGNPSYLEVVLDSTSFADFTERSEITAAIANHDQALIRELLATRKALAGQEARVKEKEREEARARAEVAAEKANVAVKAEVAEVRLKATNAERAEAERQLAAMEEASNDIEAMMSRVQRSGYSGGAYSGTWSGSLLKPVPGRFTSAFGWRIHPITRTRRFHDGIDLACPGGTPIRAADKGRVVHAGWWGPYGIAVLIDHGSGVSTLYGHCMRGSLRVSAGDIVSRGQVIAGVDSTGWSTGNHLHFGKRLYGRPVSPM